MNRPISTRLGLLAAMATMGAPHVPPASVSASNPDRKRPDYYKPRHDGYYGIPFSSFVARLARRTLRTKDFKRRAEIRRAARSRKQRRGW